MWKKIADIPFVRYENTFNGIVLSCESSHENIQLAINNKEFEQRGFQTLGTKLHPKTQVNHGILAQECGDLMKRFFAEKRK